MVLSRRQKLTIISLLFYWPGVFILAHIPIPQLVYKAQVSDKSLHFLAYLVLVFLLWFAISPNKKVNWRKAAVWWILFVVVLYGVVDELLQGYKKSMSLRKNWNGLDVDLISKYVNRKNGSILSSSAIEKMIMGEFGKTSA